MSNDKPQVDGGPRRTGSRWPRLASTSFVVIEDNIDSAETLRSVLEMAGHGVEVAYTGNEGLDLVRSQRPEVVLCDLGLPGLSGFEVAEALRADRSFDPTLIIAVTGYGQPEDRRRSQQAGFDEHLTKPVDLRTIESTVRRLRGLAD